jgi:uncharacterized protein
MQCPICHKEVDPDDALMPFCSERCRILDLGNWASEKYVISTSLAEPRPEGAVTGEDEE